MTQLGESAIVTFCIGPKLCGLPAAAVQRIVPVAELARPSGLPPSIEGFLNLAGVMLPVLRLDRLLHLENQTIEIYSSILVLKDDSVPVALLVDRVMEILYIDPVELQAVSGNDSFNACVEAVIHVREQNIEILSPRRILLEKERKSLAAFRQAEKERLEQWKPVMR